MFAVAHRFLRIFMILLWAQACGSTPISDGNIDKNTVLSDEELEVNNVDDAVVEETASEPAMVAGAYLFCTSAELDEANEKIGCDMRNGSDEKIDIAGVKVKEAYATYDNQPVAISPAADSELEYHFVFNIPRNATKIQIVMTDRDGSNIDLAVPITDPETGSARFRYLSLGAGEYMQLGDGRDDVAGDECAEDLAMPDVLDGGNFLRGQNARIEFTVFQQTLVDIALVGLCDADLRGSRIMVNSLTDQFFRPRLVRLADAAADPLFFSENLEPGTYEIELIAGFLLGAYDEILIQNMEFVSSAPLSVGAWSYNNL